MTLKIKQSSTRQFRKISICPSGKIYLFLFPAVFLFITVCSVCAETGKSGASFLKIAPTAGAEAMGGAYTAMSSDIGALYYNPAGIARHGALSASGGRFQAGFTHTAWIENMNYDFAGSIVPMIWGSLGFSVISMRSGEIDGRDSDGNQTADFESADTAFTISAARELNSRNMLGVNVKLIRQTIADESAEGFAIDMGAMRELTDKVSVGLSVRNLGPDMKFIEEKYPLPLTFTLGGMFKFAGVFGLTADMAYEPVDEKRTFRMGMQLAPARFMVLRAGYMMKAVSAVYGNAESDDFDDEEGIGGGVGFNFGSYALDYSIKPYADLGTSQRVSFRVGF
ncbi:MAG: PorV/PorQ family protein [Candidatus Omnitrophota bacterium]|nr:PorV/PorQ family protein [bacterium]